MLLCTGILGYILLRFSGIFFFWIEGWVGGVYRIQTFFGFLYFFYIYKAPKLCFSVSGSNLLDYLDSARWRHCRASMVYSSHSVPTGQVVPTSGQVVVLSECSGVSTTDFYQLGGSVCIYGAIRIICITVIPPLPPPPPPSLLALPSPPLPSHPLPSLPPSL